MVHRPLFAVMLLGGIAHNQKWPWPCLLFKTQGTPILPLQVWQGEKPCSMLHAEGARIAMSIATHLSSTSYALITTVQDDDLDSPDPCMPTAVRELICSCGTFELGVAAAKSSARGTRFRMLLPSQSSA